ncbi:MAG: FG-GAP-like repeat-containing protein [Pirellulales bacterium]
MRIVPAVAGCAGFLAAALLANGVYGVPPTWTGQGDYRLLVEIDPVSIGARPFDERPAQLDIDWDSLLQTELGLSGKADLRSLQVIRYDPTTGQPFAEGGWAYGKTDADRAFRWYDDDIPNPYPEVEGYLSNTPTGTLSPISRPNWGYFLDAEGNWDSGRLAWSHVQDGNQPSHYAIYFDALPTETVPHRASPRGFLGDGNMRTQKVGTTTTGAIETRIDVTDWDGDGLFDLVAGNLRGGMAVYKNLGTATVPSFGSSKLVTTTDGKPIDIGWNATPLVIDFDSDGVDDIVTGGQLNRVAWYKNVGTNTNRQFQYQGLVRNSSNQVLALPTTPNPERPTITADYYPVMDMVDLDGDGSRDLIAGGYVTGRLYFYKNIGANPNGTPLLELQGPLQAGGAPIDTEWGAAPTFADFTGDGLLDIVTGTFAINSGVTSEKFLKYYVNIGSATQPAFEERTVPRVGQFPAAALATPRAVDYNADGRLDLAVSTDAQMYLYRNIGTATAPRWTAGALPLPSEWGSVPLFASQFIDWNNDGHLDKIQDVTVALNLAQGNPGVYGPATSVLPAGQSIPPKPGGGDGWQWLRLFDLNFDGKTDILDADHDGKIWLHRNLGTIAAPNFDTTGQIVMQLNGTPIDVGPGPSDPPFDQLQGSRATYSVADFNENGRADLVVVNFAGAVRYYENEMAASTDTPLFTQPTLVGQLPTRGVPFAADWDDDGDLDILASASPAEMMFIENSGNDIGGRATFLPGVYVDLIDAPYDSIGLNVVDFNGDGDGDVVVDTTHRYTIFTDGSFLRHGYATGTVLGVERFTIAGDYNGNGVVDAADYVVWRDTLGQSVSPGSAADGNGNEIVDAGDYAAWRATFGTTLGSGTDLTAVPEPSIAGLLLAVAGVIGCRSASRRLGRRDAGGARLPRRSIG